MSNYYKIVKDRITKTYGLLGMGDKLFYYFLMLICFSSVFSLFDLMKKDSGTGDNSLAFVIYLGIGVSSYLGSKAWKNRIATERWVKTYKMSQEDFLTLESVNSLIDELEKNLNNLKTVSQWAVGVLTTLLVLVTTIIGNAIFKSIDVILKVLEDETIKELSGMLVKEYNEAPTSIFEVIFGSAGNLLLLLVFPIALGYLAFSTLSFVKKQVLGILYDVRYHYLKNIDSNSQE